MHWLRPPGELVYARATDLACVIKDVFNALYDLKGNEGTLLAMSARNEEKDTLIASGYFRGHSKIKIQSVVNGNVDDEFDMEECYARATMAGTQGQSLTVVVYKDDRHDVLGGRAHTSMKSTDQLAHA